MPADGKPYKYLIVYPFSVLTVVKVLIIALYGLSLWAWESVGQHPGGLVVAIADIVASAVSATSLWFIVQKFYWRKLELFFNASGAFLSFLALTIVIGNSSSFFSQPNVSHLLTLFAWAFGAWWCHMETSNNVSDLFISEWGQATEEHEIEALDQHF